MSGTVVDELEEPPDGVRELGRRRLPGVPPDVSLHALA